MKKIFKYQLGIIGWQEVELPIGAKILSVQMQHEKLFLWALVNEDKRKEKREIVLAGTGHPIEDTDDLKFLGTVQEMDGDLVWHIFEEIK